MGRENKGIGGGGGRGQQEQEGVEMDVITCRDLVDDNRENLLTDKHTDPFDEEK